jgi:hypothetical protein
VDFEDPESMMTCIQHEMHLPVGKPVKLVIHAQDVIHDVGLVSFPYENGCGSRNSNNDVVYSSIQQKK